MQLAKTCMNLFLAHIKLVKLYYDGHKLLNEWFQRLKIDSVDEEWLQMTKI